MSLPPQLVYAESSTLGVAAEAIPRGEAVVASGVEVLGLMVGMGQYLSLGEADPCPLRLPLLSSGPREKGSAGVKQMSELSH